MEPNEMVINPCEVYLAPVGEAFPLVDAAPGGNWVLLGKNGMDDYSESGVIVHHSQSIQKKRTVGSTGAKKAVRTEEDHSVDVSLEDLTLETYGKILNGNPISETSAASGVPGSKSLQMYQGATIQEYAMLVRGKISAYGAEFNGQYEIRRCYQSGKLDLTYNKSESATLKGTFELLEDLDAPSKEERFGRIVVQTANAL